MAVTKMDCNKMYTNLDFLRPLSPELFADEFVSSLNVGQLSRSEKAGKLLDHLDGLNQEDMVPFDWYSNEKSINIPVFENLSSSSPFKFENTNNANIKYNTHNYVSSVDNGSLMELEQVNCHQPREINESVYSNMQSSALTTLTVMDDSLYNECSITSPMKSICSDPSEMKIASSPFETCTVAYPTNDMSHKWLKNEALTPPESPKDEDLLKMISELEPDAFEELMFTNSVDELKSIAELKTCNSPKPVSEYGCSSPNSIDDREWSPSSNSTNDPEWSPPSSVKPTKRVKSITVVKQRGITKPYSKPDVENRKLRKKEQNKSAATRYRLKKKSEFEEMRKEQKKLAEKNAKLRSQFDDLSREVRYLKSLMRDVYRKKGLIK